MAYTKQSHAQRTCVQCSAEFLPNRKHQVFCSTACRNDRDTAKYSMLSLGRRFGVATATVGAIAELRVATDLMMRGYHVFRALSAACPCDLYAFRDGAQHLRIEVRTAYRRESDTHIYVNRTPRRDYGYDILAAVLPDRIVYEPPLPDQDAH